MRYFLWGLLIIIAVSCCDNSEKYESNINLPQLRNEWEREYEAWKKLDIQNYRFTYSLPDTLGPDWGLRITVKNGQFYESIDILTGDHEELWYAFTIDDVFKNINNAFDRDEKKIDVGKGQIGTAFHVRYDPDYHFPAFFSDTSIYNNNSVEGNGIDIIIYDFTIIDE